MNMEETQQTIFTFAALFLCAFPLSIWQNYAFRCCREMMGKDS